MPAKPKLIEYLDRMNRKERFFLVGHALGNPSFSLSSEFAKELRSLAGVTVKEDALCCMDYHLDWVHAAMVLAASGRSLEELESGRKEFESPDFATPKARKEREHVFVNQNQEDIDLLVAFEHEETTYLLFLEAKGVTGWKNSQLESKMTRLKTIFEHPSARELKVEPRFALVSPAKSEAVEFKRDYPTWAKKGDGFHWIELPIPENRLEIRRIDGGSRMWRVRTAKRPGKTV